MINIRKYERISVKVLKSSFFPKMRSYCLMFIIAVCFLFLFKMKYIIIFQVSYASFRNISLSILWQTSSAGSRSWDKGGGGSSRPLDKGEGGVVLAKNFSALRASVWSTNKGGGSLPWIRHWTRHQYRVFAPYKGIRNAGNLTCGIGNHGLWNP